MTLPSSSKLWFPFEHFWVVCWGLNLEPCACKTHTLPLTPEISTFDSRKEEQTRISYLLLL